jgi:hypothetical protein
MRTKEIAKGIGMSVIVLNVIVLVNGILSYLVSENTLLIKVGLGMLFLTYFPFKDIFIDKIYD